MLLSLLPGPNPELLEDSWSECPDELCDPLCGYRGLEVGPRGFVEVLDELTLLLELEGEIISEELELVLCPEGELLCEELLGPGLSDGWAPS